MSDQPTGKALKDLIEQREAERRRIAEEKAYNKALTYPETPKVEKKAKGGMVGSASKRADGCAQRGKTKGRMV